MKNRTKTVTAYTTYGLAVKTEVPIEMFNETTAGHRQIGTGIVMVAYRRGRRWTIVKIYSKWVCDDGGCEGVRYMAYENTSSEMPTFHYTDTAY